MGGGGGGQGATAAGLCYLAWGGCTGAGRGGKEGGSALVLDAACLHPVLLYISWEKGSWEAVQTLYFYF